MATDSEPVDAVELTGEEQPDDDNDGEDEGVDQAAPTDTGSTEDTATVHVAGAVSEPGIVELDTDSRVIDAVNAAGGPTEGAVLDGINLAAPLTDGQQILVPDPESGATGSEKASAGGSGGESTVNLNTADTTQLQTLTGIGPALAERIITHRTEVGPFTTMDDLDAVSGIGPAMMERLDGLVSW